MSNDGLVAQGHSDRGLGLLLDAEDAFGESFSNGGDVRPKLLVEALHKFLFDAKPKRLISMLGDIKDPIV